MSMDKPDLPLAPVLRTTQKKEIITAHNFIQKGRLGTHTPDGKKKVILEIFVLDNCGCRQNLYDG